MGKDINDQLQDDKLADAALDMLDCSDMRIDLGDGEVTTVSWEEWLHALRPSEEVSDKEVNIRKCFDSLFYFMHLMEHYVERDLILLDDVAYPLSYYVQHRMGTHREVFLSYIDFFKLGKAGKFFKRLEQLQT